jgi:hypothetical protein
MNRDQPKLTSPAVDEAVGFAGRADDNLAGRDY